MSRPRLFATDLDGTFLDSAGEVSEINAAAVRRADELGIPFVVATGRPSRWLQVLDDLDGLFPLVVVSNGAGVFDLRSGEFSEVNGLDIGIALEVAEDLRAAIPDLQFGLEWGQSFGLEPGLRSLESDRRTIIAELAQLATRPEPALKLLVVHTRLASDELAARSVEAIGDRLTMTHSHSGDYGLLEISAPGITKAAALASVCAALGVDAAEVAAFGDMPNDLAMLEWAGQGYVMGNAHPTLLASDFTVIGPNTDSGVGRQVLDLL